MAHPPNVDVAGRGAPLRRRRRGPAHHLLDGGRQQRQIGAQQGQLAGVLGKRQQPARDRVARGLRARTEQQAEEQVELDFRKDGRRNSSPSSVAFATTDSMSSVGAARFDAISSWP